MVKMIVTPLVALLLILFPQQFIVSHSTPGNSVIAHAAGQAFERALHNKRASYLVDTVPNIVIHSSLMNEGLVYDADLKKVVWQKGLNTRADIASLSKMMTVLLVMESIQEKKYTWDSKVKIQKECTWIGGSSVDLQAGEVFTVHELVEACLIASGNDACYSLAQYTSGSEKEFAKLMNWRAAELGMDNTLFFNSTGLPIYRGNIYTGFDDNYSTPNDLLLLAIELIKHPEATEISSRPIFSIIHNNKKFDYSNHNALLFSYPEVDGLKTGFTRGAGFCLVATATKSGHHLISVILGTATIAGRTQVAVEMMNNYFASLAVPKLGIKQ